ncbi:putative dimethylallylpyrophosphate transferase [Massarina eburnea CBS 473.64]|uniref:Putative dimethylallylpyrophosphate transferase n=1 Tax=Massarina eburnea CBS 473.64 TaxID=1395130 RepID=A0A6A6SDP0_9PLEO|nr:putative dimethylallylpyrophosphate transferase [Massarina eburnea CBS 473.64]
MATNPSADAKQPTAVWNALSQYMPKRAVDVDYWWQRAGPQASIVLEKAGYSVAEQYNALLFLYHWITPELGPRVNSKERKWRSLLAADGTPFELSWKWNKNGGKPEVRYVLEPVNQFSGTTLDPLNAQPSMELRHRLGTILPKVDLTWCHHFAGALFGPDKARLERDLEKAAHRMPPGFTVPSTLVALEFPHGGTVGSKSYFIPRKHGQGPWLPIPEFEEAIQALDPVNEARRKVSEFASRGPDPLTPIMLAVDDRAVGTARIKWYFATGRSSLNWAREIMTLGGVITAEHLPHLDTQLSEMAELIKALTGVPDDYPEDVDLPPHSRFDPTRGEGNYIPLPVPVAGYQAHFNIAPGSDVPNVKLYIPMRRYARDDISVARGLVRFLETRGKRQDCQQYMDMLEGILPADRHLDNVNCLQSYVSCLFKKDGDMELTTYLGMSFYNDEHKAVSPELDD